VNIVVICDYARIEGGASQVALTSALALARRGLSVTLFAGAGRWRRICGTTVCA
jgi:hypothetical protein